MLKKLVAIFTLFSLFSLVGAPITYAEIDPFEQACSAEGADSAVCQDKASAAGNPVVDTVHDVVNILAIVTGIAAVIMLIVGGIKYMLADGDSGKISSAKNTIIYALIGIVVVLVARALIAFVINRL